MAVRALWFCAQDVLDRHDAAGRATQENTTLRRELHESTMRIDRLEQDLKAQQAQNVRTGRVCISLDCIAFSTARFVSAQCVAHFSWCPLYTAQAALKASSEHQLQQTQRQLQDALGGKQSSESDMTDALQRAVKLSGLNQELQEQVESLTKRLNSDGSNRQQMQQSLLEEMTKLRSRATDLELENARLKDEMVRQALATPGRRQPTTSRPEAQSPAGRTASRYRDPPSSPRSSTGRHTPSHVVDEVSETQAAIQRAQEALGQPSHSDRERYDPGQSVAAQAAAAFEEQERRRESSQKPPSRGRARSPAARGIAAVQVTSSSPAKSQPQSQTPLQTHTGNGDGRRGSTASYEARGAQQHALAHRTSSFSSWGDDGGAQGVELAPTPRSDVYRVCGSTAP